MKNIYKINKEICLIKDNMEHKIYTQYPFLKRNQSAWKIMVKREIAFNIQLV